MSLVVVKVAPFTPSLPSPHAYHILGLAVTTSWLSNDRNDAHGGTLYM